MQEERNATTKPEQNSCPDRSENNGGATDYYDLPPVLSERPTLEDLIEYKDMRHWRGEAFKALYALEERAARSNDSNSSEIREIYKVIYFCNRRLAMLDREETKRQKEVTRKLHKSIEQLPKRTESQFPILNDGNNC